LWEGRERGVVLVLVLVADDGTEMWDTLER
jgi:hypothetical protein